MMRLPSYRLWLPAAIVLTIFLIATAPARLLLWVIPSSVSLSGVGGTVWQGHAARAAFAFDDHVFMLGKVDWQIHPWTLLTGEPRASLDSRWGRQEITGDFAVNWRQELVISDLTASVDLGWTRQVLPLFVEGQVRADIRNAVLVGNRLAQVDGRLTWQRAAWAARAGALPLGNYALDLGSGDNRVTGDVVTLSGGLVAEGAIEVDGSNYRVALTLSGPAMSDSGLQQSMALFAVPDGDSYVVDLRGSL